MTEVSRLSGLPVSAGAVAWSCFRDDPITSNLHSSSTSTNAAHFSVYTYTATTTIGLDFFPFLCMLPLHNSPRFR